MVFIVNIAQNTMETRAKIANEVQSSIERYIEKGSTLGAYRFPTLVLSKPAPNHCRLLCIMKDYRGVLREFLNILSSHNVEHQQFEQKEGLGYLVVDVKGGLESDIIMQMARLANSVRIRMVGNKYSL